MRSPKEWRRERRRARTILWMRNRAAELGVPTWHLTDEEIVKSVTIACAIAASQAMTVTDAMKRLTAATQAAARAAQDFRRVFEPIPA